MRQLCRCDSCTREGEAARFQQEGFCAFCAERCYPRQENGTRLALSRASRQELHATGEPPVPLEERVDTVVEALVPHLKRGVRYLYERFTRREP